MTRGNGQLYFEMTPSASAPSSPNPTPVSVPSPRTPLNTTASGKVAKPKATRVRTVSCRRMRPGDVRPILEFEKKNRSIILDQLKKTLRPMIQFSRGSVMYDEKAEAQSPADLQAMIYATYRPSTDITEQAVFDACRAMRDEKLVPTATFVSNLPQLAPNGVVLTQPGCAGTRVFTHFVESPEVATVQNISGTIAPNIHDFMTGTAAERALEGYPVEAARLFAAIVAPSLINFPGHMDFFTHPQTAAWLLPALDVEFVNATLPAKAKVTALSRSMRSTAAVNGTDSDAISTVKQILSRCDVPVYRVLYDPPGNIATIPVCDGEKPRKAVIDGISAFIVEALRKAPPLPETATFRDALDAILLAADLPGADAVIIPMRVPVSKAKVKAKVKQDLPVALEEEEVVAPEPETAE